MKQRTALSMFTCAHLSICALRHANILSFNSELLFTTQPATKELLNVIRH